jgi:hypothetical protein
MGRIVPGLQYRSITSLHSPKAAREVNNLAPALHKRECLAVQRFPDLTLGSKGGVEWLALKRAPNMAISAYFLLKHAHRAVSDGINQPRNRSSASKLKQEVDSFGLKRQCQCKTAFCCREARTRKEALD